MKRITASIFRAQCVKVLSRVQKTGEPVMITKWGKPAAKVVPAAEENELFGFMKGRMVIVGDIVPPLPDWACWRPGKNL